MNLLKDWTIFNGSVEQIEEIKNAVDGIIFYDSCIHYDEWIFYPTEHDLSGIDTTTLIAYYICEPHPYRKLIQHWSITGQVVYIKCNVVGLHRLDPNHISVLPKEPDGFYYYKSNKPNFHIKNAEYSLTPFANVFDILTAHSPKKD